MRRGTDHAFCRSLLIESRAEAARLRIAVPTQLSALPATRNTYFVEAPGIQGTTVKGDCAYSAKAHYIMGLVEAKEAGAA